MNSIQNLEIKNKCVLVRVDFNVPLGKNLEILDDTRVTAALPTLEKILSGNNKLIIMSHLGRPKNTPKKSLSLVHLVDRLSTLLNKKVLFSKNCIGSETKKLIEKMDFGSVLLLENLRFNYGETSGSHSFAKELANLADVYVNDAFGVSHRKHASTSVIAKFFLNNKFSGLLIDKELDALNKSIKNPKKPITAIIGGSKIQGKVNVIDSLLDKVDNLIIGGGMAFTFDKVLNGT